MGLLEALTSLDWERLHLGYIPEQALAGIGSSTKPGTDQTAWKPRMAMEALVVLEIDDWVASFQGEPWYKSSD